MRPLILATLFCFTTASTPAKADFAPSCPMEIRTCTNRCNGNTYLPGNRVLQIEIIDHRGNVLAQRCTLMKTEEQCMSRL